MRRSGQSWRILQAFFIPVSFQRQITAFESVDRRYGTVQQQKQQLLHCNYIMECNCNSQRRVNFFSNNSESDRQSDASSSLLRYVGASWWVHGGRLFVWLPATTTIQYPLSCYNDIVDTEVLFIFPCTALFTYLANRIAF